VLMRRVLCLLFMLLFVFMTAVIQAKAPALHVYWVCMCSIEAIGALRCALGSLCVCVISTCFLTLSPPI
jgi:hypothetical protein